MHSQHNSADSATSFNIYTPKVESKAIEKVTFANANLRINEAYQIKLENIDNIEIIAGIKCKEYADKFGKILSKDYVELAATELADYLGAPVLYMDSFGDVVNHKYFIKDMQNSDRTSNIVELGTCHNGRLSGSIVDVSTVKFLGIVQGKVFDEETSEEDDMEDDEEREYQQLFTTNQFRMETTTMLASDPFILKGGVLFDNVKPGIWKWNTTNKTQDDDDSEPSLTAQLVAVHSDYEKLLDDSNIWLIPEERTEDYEFTGRNEYFENEMEGGWFQMKSGVSSDAQVVGLFDQKYFNDEKQLSGNVRHKNALEENFQMSYETPWQEYYSNKMDEEGFPEKMEVPYGIITSSGYGDGYYSAFFKKSKDGEVIAVKIFFV